MFRNATILLAAAAIISLPFLFRQRAEVTTAEALPLVIVTPHNEAIRYEFGRAFSTWHQRQYGRPVNIDWRAIGGATEISRYLSSEYLNAARAWWRKCAEEDWPAGASDILLDGGFAATRGDALSRLWKRFRDTDDHREFSARVDLLFGGGSFDHLRAYSQGLTVAPWPDGGGPSNLFFAADGTPMLPERMSGETWRTPAMLGAAISTFGICFNLDRLRELGVTKPPAAWDDLADFRLFKTVGVADPTKSGSIAKAFELIVHQQCAQAVAAAGFDEQQIEQFEAAIAVANLPPGEVPPDVPAAYQQALAAGWRDGLALIQRIGANARYFTDSASKVPVDVGMGFCAAGLSIDFYARFEAESTASRGRDRMGFVVPAGGTGAACDPISLLRGAEHRELAVRFIEFLLGEDGQKIWCYRPGTPGGPEKYALRRIPIRRDFFPSDDPALNARHREHLRYAADNLADPAIDPYAIARTFHYHARWTGRHFGILRDIVRAMCIDASAELQRAWPAASRDPALLAELARLPDRPAPLDWKSALVIPKEYDRMDLMRTWTEFYRANYRRVAAGARAPAGAAVFPSPGGARPPAAAVPTVGIDRAAGLQSWDGSASFSSSQGSGSGLRRHGTRSMAAP